MDLDEGSFIPADSTLATDLNTFGVYKKNALHIYGVDELKTNEIFDLFKGDCDFNENLQKYFF